MIATLHSFLKKYLGAAEEAPEDDVLALQMATAVLLMEVARADSGISKEEREAVERIIETRFALSPDETRRIAGSAEQQAVHVTSLYPFTRLINRECSPEDKISMVRMLWQVTCADGDIDKHEEHLVRKIAGLLHVPHREYIRAKLQVVEG